MIVRISSETEFTRRVSNTDTEKIKITVYIDYLRRRYTIVSPNEEAVKLEHYSIDRLNAHISLLRQAHKFIKQELSRKEA